jgi:HSP20 family protein
MSKKNQITNWDPFKELEDLQDRMRSLFVRSGNGDSFLTNETDFADWSPAVDISEDEKEFTITADLPDVKKEEVKVSLDDGMLTIKGERQHKEETKKKKFHRVERSYGKYVRSFRLPDEVESDKIDAAFKDGVLTVHLPKGEKSKSREKEIAIH